MDEREPLADILKRATTSINDANANVRRGRQPDEPQSQRGRVKFTELPPNENEQGYINRVLVELDGEQGPTGPECPSAVGAEGLSGPIDFNSHIEFSDQRVKLIGEAHESIASAIEATAEERLNVARSQVAEAEVHMDYAKGLADKWREIGRQEMAGAALVDNQMLESMKMLVQLQDKLAVLKPREIPTTVSPRMP